MTIRTATEADLPAILAIYNDAVLNSTAIWNWNVTDLANRQAWFEARRAQAYPILVAAEEGAVLGYASYGAGVPSTAIATRWSTRSMSPRPPAAGASAAPCCRS